MLNFIICVLPWYALVIVSSANIVPLWVAWVIVAPTLLFALGVRDWARFRGWPLHWWLPLAPLGFIGWLMVRLDVPLHLSPRYVSMDTLNAMGGTYQRTSSLWFDLIAQLVDLVIVLPTITAWRYTLGFLLAPFLWGGRD